MINEPRNEKQNNKHSLCRCSNLLHWRVVYFGLRNIFHLYGTHVFEMFSRNLSMQYAAIEKYSVSHIFSHRFLRFFSPNLSEKKNCSRFCHASSSFIYELLPKMDGIVHSTFPCFHYNFFTLFSIINFSRSSKSVAIIHYRRKLIIAFCSAFGILATDNCVYVGWMPGLEIIYPNISGNQFVFGYRNSTVCDKETINLFDNR